jgi:histidyl-tRNA synthetase
MAMNLSAQDFLRSAITTAHHFGFNSLDKLKQDPGCKNCTEKIVHKASAADKRNDALHGLLTAGMGTYFDNKLNGIAGPAFFYSTQEVPRSGETAITFQVFNVKKSIAEAILIQTIRALLTDVGYAHHSVRVNSLGDTDSVTRYVRELTNFLKKRMDDMPPPARELMKEHPLVALMHLIEKEHELARKSPSPLEYLTDQSRKHFREIVEFLDISGIPYEIDPKLIGHHECYSDALFAFDIKDEEDEPLEASPFYIRGGRYSTFVSRMSKSKIPAVGAVVVLRDKKAPVSFPVPRIKHDPSIYLVQLGFGPKIKSLLLIDELRRAGVPVYQNIISDSLSEQLRTAEAKNVRYAVIVGQKEYVEGNVILRDLHAQSQQNIPMTAIASHLRRATAAV